MTARWYLLASAILLLSGAAQPAEFLRGGTVTYRCTNPASSATWVIEIDLERQVADSYLASISDRQITWHNTGDAGNYYLDRATGRLTVIRASSTGGYAIFDICAAGH
jgi:hypothetical protein